MRYNNLKLIEKLIVGIDVNEIYLRETHLHFACFLGSMSVVKIFIEAGANINAIDVFGRTPLFVAVVISGASDIVKFLIDKGADVNHCDHHGSTASHSAVWSPFYSSTYNLSLLIAAGADISISNKYGKTPRNLAKIYWSLKDFDASCSHKVVQLTGFRAIRKRAMEICIAMYDLDLDALRMSEIVIVACAPFAEHLEFHYIWDLVTTVKHFHQRQEKTKFLLKQ
jgi:hypothetical protein